MTRHSLYGLAAMLISLAAGCSHPGAARETAPLSKSHPVRPLLRFERTMCFGSCPVYELALFDDGRLRYEGSDNVADPGPVEVRIAPAGMTKIRASIERIAALKSDCCNCYDWTDSPSVNLTFRVPGGTDVKKIEHYHGCESAPDWLYDMENSIDEALGTERWVGRKIDYKPYHPKR